MTTKDALEKIDKQLLELLEKQGIHPNDPNDEASQQIYHEQKQFIHTALSTLLQQVGEEVIGEDKPITDKEADIIVQANQGNVTTIEVVVADVEHRKIRDELRKEIRSRLDSVINSLPSEV
jgi:hypothetical protein